MNDIQTQARTPRKKPLLKAVIWMGATGFALCFLVVCGASIWIWGSVDSYNRLSAPPCPSGISPPAEAKIAFASSHNSKTTYSDIFIINADGSKQTQLTHSSDLMDAGEPIWSKDGEKLFFYSYPNYEFWVMNADGSDLTSIPKPNVYYNLSPDEKQKVFVENDDIYLMNADGSGQNKLTSHASDRVNVAPAWSPDGTKIAFLLYYPAGSEDLHPSYNHLFTIRPDGTGLIDINNSAISFSWSPDGCRQNALHRSLYLC